MSSWHPAIATATRTAPRTAENRFMVMTIQLLITIIARRACGIRARHSVRAHLHRRGGADFIWQHRADVSRGLTWTRGAGIGDARDAARRRSPGDRAVRRR